MGTALNLMHLLVQIKTCLFLEEVHYSYQCTQTEQKGNRQTPVLQPHGHQGNIKADISSSDSVLRVPGKGARTDFVVNIFPSQNNEIGFHAVLPDSIFTH